MNVEIGVLVRCFGKTKRVEPRHPGVVNAVRKMSRSDESINIPIELLRTVVEIVEAGGFTKAAARLGISQPGVSAHIKKLQTLVGGQVFDRSAGGIALTERGRTLLPLARRVLDANDEILRVGGVGRGEPPIRVGVTALYAQRIVEAVAKSHPTGTTVLCGESDEIEKGLHDGYIDAGCLLGAQTDSKRCFATWYEEMVWVRARNFVLSPGSPIPIVGMPGLMQDRIAMAALQRRGLPYRHVFVAADLTARLAAVGGSLGLMPLTARCARGDLVVANEYYLPPLGKVEAGIYLREDIGLPRLEPLLARLVQALQPVAHVKAHASSTDHAASRLPSGAG